MKTPQLILLAATLTLSACASLHSEPKAATTSQYTPYVGEPVREIDYTRFHNWDKVDDRTVVVWTKPSQAYLLTLQSACWDLSGREMVAVDGFGGRLRAGTDSIIAGRMRCRIKTIQPIDLARMKAARG